MSIQLTDGLANQSVDLVLEDLLVRFLVNVPDEDLSSIERVFFQIEEAQWFYTDFVRQLNPLLPSMKMKSFSTKVLKKCPLIWKWGDPLDAISRFGKYKSTIPVRGVALFNKDLTKVVLVKGTESNAWSFPRGKISKDESDIDCAIREVEEETGFNARDLISENDVIERTIKGKNYKIYMVKNVPEDYNFQPLARNEISKIQWHDIKSIQKKSRSNPNNYFIVSAILKPMLRWINKNKGILNEEELMLQAEIKLKSLLGINQPKQENLDAGRELLNILQGVGPKDNNIEANNQNMPSTYDQIIQMNIPQQLHKQFPFFNNQQIQPQPYPIPNQPFFVPQMPPNAFAPMDLSTMNFQQAPYSAPPPSQQIPVSQHDSLSSEFVNQQPNPQSLQKPSSISNRRPSGVNSKEFLSILNKPRSKEEESKISDELRANGHENNRSKAQQLLSLFNKNNSTDNNSPDTGSRANGKKILTNEYPNRHVTSNELNESLVNAESKTNSTIQGDSGKKMTILKRPTNTGSDKVQSNSDASADILSMLGNTSNLKEEKTVEENIPNPSNELLGLLKGDKKVPESQSNAHELLGLINTKNNNKEASHKPNSNDKGRPAHNLGLHSGNENYNGEHGFADFEDFEDFENFDDYDHHGHSHEDAITNFEIASDEESVSDAMEYEDARDEYNIPQKESHIESPKSNTKKNKIRLLKPGESLNDILGNPATASADVDVQKNPAQELENNRHEGHDSKLLLDILNGGKPQANIGVENKDSSSSNFTDFGAIYGAPSMGQPSPAPYFSPGSEKFSPFENSVSSLPPDSQVNSPTAQSNVNPASASLLSLLGKKPPAQQVSHKSPESQAPQPVRTFTLDDLENAQLGQTESGPGVSHLVQSPTAQEISNPAENQPTSARTLLDLLKGGKS